MWTDESLNLNLLRKGILTRIYAPMVGFIQLFLIFLSWVNQYVGMYISRS